MKVLGIDPGFGRMGWAVVEGDSARQELIEAGCLETNPKEVLENRLVEMYQYINTLLQSYKPDEAAVEELFFFKNQKTVMAVGQARGVIVLTLKLAGLPVGNYTPLQIKSTVAGYGRADKTQVQLMVKTQLRLKKAPRPDDAADACAVALTHIFSEKLGKI